MHKAFIITSSLLSSALLTSTLLRLMLSAPALVRLNKRSERINNKLDKRATRRH